MNVYSAREFMSLSFLDTALVEGGILHERSRVIVSGGPGVGKSYLVTQIAWESALGEDWLGIFGMKRPLRTMLLQTEVAAKPFQERLEVLGEAPAELYFCLGETFALARDVGELVKYIEGLGIEFVIFDPMYTIQEGDENTLEAAKATFRIIDKLRQDYNGTFLMVQHPNQHGMIPSGRPNLTWLRGHTSWPGWVDTVFFMMPEHEGVRLYLLKARNRKSALPKEPWTLAWGTERFFVPGDCSIGSDVAEIAEVIERLGGRARQADVVDALRESGHGKSWVYARLAELCEEGSLRKDGRYLVIEGG